MVILEARYEGCIAFRYGVKSSYAKEHQERIIQLEFFVASKHYLGKRASTLKVFSKTKPRM